MTESTNRGATPAPLDRSRPPRPGPLRPFSFPDIERHALSNGVPVLYAHTRGLPVVTFGLLLSTGATDEAPERAGIATLTSALLESGAGARTAAQIAEDLERLGGQLSVGASWDASHVDLTGLTSRLPAAASILADLVRRPRFPADEVERIRNEQLAGILQRRADPRGLAAEMSSRFIFSEATPYARPTSGTAATVGSLTREDVVAFHATHFTPQVAGLVVAGEIGLERALEIAGEHLADWAGARPDRQLVPVSPRSTAVEVIIVDRPGSVQSEIRVGHVGVARDTPDYFPLTVMNAVLGGAFSSRLNLNLRERQGFTYGVSSTFAMRRQPGPFLISTAVQTEVTAPALTEILTEVGKMREAPVSDRELQDARNYLAGTFPLRLQTTDGVASRLAELLLYDLPLDYFDSYRDRILQVTAEDVLRVAREHLRPDEFTVVVVGDASAVRKPLESLSLGPVRVVDVEGNG